MSTQAPLPGRLNEFVPENGYESPLSPENGQMFFSGDSVHNVGGRRRAAFTGGTDETLVEGATAGFRSNLQGNDRAGNENGNGKDVSDGGGPRKIGFRERIGCYTWTWFTMTMATGGIANVLHASKTL